ncbi:MAG: DUF3592 domain-containing protein [Planctomycetes bacterium]|nr:DUF3592 domain-containing protein [Planctomycetota bacterium]
MTEASPPDEPFLVPSPEDFAVDDFDDPTPPGSTRKVWRVAAIAFGVLSLPGLVFSAWWFHRAEEGRNWPTIEGLVIGGQTTLSSNPKTPGWRPHFQYTFRVNGEKYTSFNYFLLGEVGMSDEENSSLHLRYFENPSCRVHYNPVDPQDCFLEEGSDAMGWVFGAVSLVFLVLVSGFCLHMSITATDPATESVANLGGTPR